MNTTIKALHERTSVRVFEEKEIYLEDKKAILDAAIQAPTAGNQMMYTILNISDVALLQTLAKSCDDQMFIASAKFALVFVADYQKWMDVFSMVESSPRQPDVGELLLGCNDALIAAQNAVVAAQSLGIGSCYIGDIMEHHDTHKALLKLPQYCFPVTMLVFGYPTEQQQNRKKPVRFDRKYIVHENTYHRMSNEELKAMFVARASLQEEVSFDFEKWIHAFYQRKFNSNFAKEMSASVQKYIDDFKTSQ
ncbi:MAG: nitroreductase family protein [Breznakia sp.]